MAAQKVFKVVKDGTDALLPVGSVAFAGFYCPGGAVCCRRQVFAVVQVGVGVQADEFAQFGDEVEPGTVPAEEFCVCYVVVQCAGEFLCGKCSQSVDVGFNWDAVFLPMCVAQGGSGVVCALRSERYGAEEQGLRGNRGVLEAVPLLKECFPGRVVQGVAQ